MISTFETERDLIGSVLSTKNEVQKAMAIDSISLSMFNNKVNKDIWGAIKSLSDEGQIVDFIGVSGRASEHEAWIIEICQESVGVDSLLAGYVDRVKRGAYLYEAHKRTEAALAVINELTDLTAVESIAGSIEEVFSGLELDTINNKPLHFKEAAKDYIQVLKDKSNGLMDEHIIMSGIPDLDNLTGGFNRTDLIVLAGLSGSGKTEAAIKVMTSLSELNKGSQLIFSLEMSNQQVVERAVGMGSGLPISSLRNPEKLDEFNGWAKISTATGNLIKNDMYLYDQTGLSVRNIVTMSRAHKARHPDLNLILVDHVGLMELEGNGQHHMQVGDISKRLKMLSKELKVPVVMLSQVVGKQIMQRGVRDRIPNAQDIKDTSRLEEDADLILFTHRQNTHDDQAPDFSEWEFGKARHAIKGSKVYFKFVNGHFMDTDQGNAESVMNGYYNASSNGKKESAF